jgi:perosamine synthetase
LEVEGSMMNLPLFRIYWDDKDLKGLENVVRSGKEWAIGPQISMFEGKLSEYLGVSHAKTFNSGGTALHALLQANNIGKGDEVIVPSFTFIATAFAPLYVNAKPVFCDIEEGLLGLDPSAVEKAIGKKTKAILPIHYGGFPCKIEELKDLADDHDLILIEDAAESMGTIVDGKKVASFGQSAILSFCQNKVITTGEGGAAVTDDEEVSERLDLIRSYGRANNEKYFSSGAAADYVGLGNNWRMSSLAAALGTTQLDKIEKIIKMRRERAARLTDLLARVPGLSMILEPPRSRSVYQMFTVRVNKGKKKRNELQMFLQKKGISSKVYFDPVHKTEFFKEAGFGEVRLPMTEKISGQVLTLPFYVDMTDGEMDYLVHCIKEYFAEG